MIIRIVSSWSLLTRKLAPMSVLLLKSDVNGRIVIHRGECRYLI